MRDRHEQRGFECAGLCWMIKGRDELDDACNDIL